MSHHVARSWQGVTGSCAIGGTTHHGHEVYRQRGALGGRPPTRGRTRRSGLGSAAPQPTVRHSVCHAAIDGSGGDHSGICYTAFPASCRGLRPSNIRVRDAETVITAGAKGSSSGGADHSTHGNPARPGPSSVAWSPRARVTRARQRRPNRHSRSSFMGSGVVYSVRTPPGLTLRTPRRGTSSVARDLADRARPRGSRHW